MEDWRVLAALIGLSAIPRQFRLSDLSAWEL